jgi:hypothetical protein
MSRIRAIVLSSALSLILGLILALVVGCGPSTVPRQPGQVLVLQTQNLVNGMITVPAGTYYAQPFSVTSRMQSVKVSGSFHASGGSGNDIETYILDDMAYTNWASGHQVNTFYNSGCVTVANIDAPLATPGTYYLVFNNRFSTFASKQVSTTVNLEWYELR